MNFVIGMIAFLMTWAATVGYFMNIVQIFHANQVSFEVAGRVLGIVFFPIGCVIGYF